MCYVLLVNLLGEVVLNSVELVGVAIDDGDHLFQELPELVCLDVEGEELVVDEGGCVIGSCEWCVLH